MIAHTILNAIITILDLYANSPKASARGPTVVNAQAMGSAHRVAARAPSAELAKTKANANPAA